MLLSAPIIEAYQKLNDYLQVSVALVVISFFTEHCLGSLLEVAAALVVELLLRMHCPSLSLCVLQRLVLEGRRRLLQAHPRSGRS